MKDIIVYVRVEKYIKDWLEFHLGNPVRFPERSYENALLHSYLCKRPACCPPDRGGEGTVAVVVTDCRHRKPEYYNHLSSRGHRAMASAIDSLFRLALWSGIAPLLGTGAELNRGIDRWCREQGISFDSREAVRQKFYRMRRAYMKKGIVLGRFYKKKTATIECGNVHGREPR